MKEDERRILVAEMSWLRKILGRPRRDRIRNEGTRKELGQQVTLVDKIADVIRARNKDGVKQTTVSLRGARWSSWINAANGARGPRFASRILPTVQRPWTSR